MLLHAYESTLSSYNPAYIVLYFIESTASMRFLQGITPCSSFRDPIRITPSFKRFVTSILFFLCFPFSIRILSRLKLQYFVLLNNIFLKYRYFLRFLNDVNLLNLKVFFCQVSYEIHAKMYHKLSQNISFSTFIAPKSFLLYLKNALHRLVGYSTKTKQIFLR